MRRIDEYPTPEQPHTPTTPGRMGRVAGAALAAAMVFGLAGGDGGPRDHGEPTIRLVHSTGQLGNITPVPDA